MFFTIIYFVLSKNKYAVIFIMHVLTHVLQFKS